MEENLLHKKLSEGIEAEHKSILDMFNSEPFGMSFDSCDNDSDSGKGEKSEIESDSNSCSSSEFELAKNCEVSERVMLALKTQIEKEHSKEDDGDEYKFPDNPDHGVGDSDTEKKSKCCNLFCSNQCPPTRFHNKMKEIMQKPKAARKQFLLDHLFKQEDLDVRTDGFQFFGLFFCKSSFVQLSGVSDYLVGEACKAFEHGQTVFSHGNTAGMRETEATLGFIIWTKQHALNYGNQAPDEECIILSAIYKQKDLFQQYSEEAPLPRIARSTFYRLFRLKFGPYREDKELPHIRISSYSSHSRCDTCLLLEKYKMTCKTEEERVLLRSMEQRHKQTYQKSYQSIQEKRYQAIYDPINYIHIQGKETFAKRVFFKVKINLAQWLVQLQSLGFLYVICYLSNNSDVDRLSYYNVTTRLVDLVGLCWFKQNLTEKIC